MAHNVLALTEFSSMITLQIVADMYLCKEYDREVEVIVTCDHEFGEGVAKKILDALYPPDSDFLDVEINTIE